MDAQATALQLVLSGLRWSSSPKVKVLACTMGGQGSENSLGQGIWNTCPTRLLVGLPGLPVAHTPSRWPQRW